MSEPHHFARLLGANPFFADLGTEVVEAIATLCVTRSLRTEEVLFMKGDPGDALYAVRRGQIRIATGTDAGRRLTLNLLGSGDVFGEVALLDGRPRTADAIATEPSELFMVRRRDFVDLIAHRPAVAVRIIELLCDRIRWMSDRMEESVLMPLPARLARRLLALGDDYGAEIPGFAGGARGLHRLDPGERQQAAPGVEAPGPDRDRPRPHPPHQPAGPEARAGGGRGQL